MNRPNPSDVARDLDPTFYTDPHETGPPPIVGIVAIALIVAAATIAVCVWGATVATMIILV